MGAQRFLIATVLGGFSLFLVGSVMWGFVLANAYPVSVVDREVPLILWLALSQFAWAAALTVIIGKWPGASTPGGGFKAAAIIGFLTSVSVGLGFYSMMTLPISIMSYVDPFLWALNFGIAGAGIGWWLGRGSPAHV